MSAKGFIVGCVLSLLVLSCSHTQHPQEKFLMATLYQQKSPEVKAMYHQAYNSAKDSLAKKLKQKKYQKMKNKCVVLDVDETVLDNSPYQGWLYHNRKSYSSETWNHWVLQAKAPLLPGVKNFIEFAQSKNVKPLYITNRLAQQEEATYKNLTAKGLRVLRKDLVGRSTDSSKVERRQRFQKDCQILMLIGDSLADFHEVFEGDYQERLRGVKSFKAKWGREFFVLPNPMYGDWTRKSGLESLEKAEIPL